MDIVMAVTELDLAEGVAADDAWNAFIASARTTGYMQRGRNAATNLQT